MELDPRADRLRERSIDRHSSVRASVVISFGLTGRARSQSSCHGMDRVFAAEFEVAGSRFVGRSFNVGGISPRHASISVHSRDRDVSCVDFVSIIHPDYRPEPIRAARTRRTLIKLARSSPRRRRDDGGDLANDRRPSLAYFWDRPISSDTRLS